MLTWRLVSIISAMYRYIRACIHNRHAFVCTNQGTKTNTVVLWTFSFQNTSDNKNILSFHQIKVSVHGKIIL